MEAAVECSPRPAVALGVGGGERKPQEGGPMGARKGSRHPGCQDRSCAGGFWRPTWLHSVGASSVLSSDLWGCALACEQASEHVPQEDMVVELPQDWAEDEPLRTVDESGEACEHAPQEHLVVELPQAWAEESPLRPLEAAGAANEHECFLENISSSDAEENAATPDECCPQTPRNCMAHIEDLEESKTIERPKRYLVIFLKTASEEVSSDDEEDLEEQE
ncbi:uncharacterized protein LOC123327534 [Bubalus bubalis]|uniref:uncharacterized protein LOC123327534 n=1 Tax=Bubalus bubalis TaxID=89462 RepID=UPI001E1B829F|nr:uncharacterized protein LOC123327534 [Bubalus bubalis]